MRADMPDATDMPHIKRKQYLYTIHYHLAEMKMKAEENGDGPP